MIVSCCGCERVSFATLSMNSEDIEFDDDNKGKYVETIYQYPIPRIGFDNLIDDYNIPESIRLVYKQTCNSIANNDYLIAGIGLRTIIEAICLYEQILGKTLKTKITNLFKSGVISKRDCDILHAIRFIGNEATHMIQSPTKEQVSIVIRIVENLFENKYCLCEKTNDNLDMPFNDYNNFYNYVVSKLRVLEIDKDLCIDDIWEKGKKRYYDDRVNEYVTYLEKCKTDIKNCIDKNEVVYYDVDNKYNPKYKFTYKDNNNKLIILKDRIKNLTLF